MKQWTKNNMKLLSKLRANTKRGNGNGRQSSSSATEMPKRAMTSRQLAAMEEAQHAPENNEADAEEGHGQPYYNPLTCCVAADATAVASIAEGSGTTGSSTRSGGGGNAIRSGYGRFDNDDDGAMIPYDEKNSQTNEQQEQDQKRRPHIIKELFLFFVRRSWKKKLFTVLAVCTIVPVLYDLIVLGSSGNSHVREWLDSFLGWMSQNPILGVWAYVLMIALASLIFVPPSILVFAAGFTFRSIWDDSSGLAGILIALVSSFLGSMIGGLAGYWRARYMTRDLIEVLMRRYPIIRALDAAIVKNSLRVMILMRLNCLIPFGVLNYCFGITGVDWAEFLLAMVGILPWHLLLVCLGAGSATVYDEGEATTLMRVGLIATGVAFGIIGLAIMWKHAKRELQKEVDATPPITANDYRINDPSLRPQRSPNRKMSQFLTKKMSSTGLENDGTKPVSVENADLDYADYFLIQCLGENRDIAEGTYNGEVIEVDYQKKLNWNEIILDDFS
mmetsp:Transcript_16187/g.38805  ORF Transcript_16187/g.38805 Transcript_16187/m.38805 type:complete len:503 (-) Transcript_16187:123-1631(-)|eukprot:CAMPEP_0181123894 /NCGR_PEP_ID=MMETSP1071-20121207/26168_1 /TAXON_ID=35127 /ORGANISM="Thalassiosira sp., Strain NH16" /LENGTH=502 /DNA_ID=CAMNT_0023209117 /DNA_START=253 /DNA_END=1761 /DNA_ORIENTATION=+